MARQPRIVAPGSILHLGSRGAVRQQLFRDDADRDEFLRQFQAVTRKFEWSCLSYCLMGNHYHLLVEIREANLSEGMQYLNGKYARVFNDRHRGEGCVFDGRFWSRHVKNDRYFHAVVRYINLNPVEAGICRSPEQWAWSSHRELIAELPAQRVAVPRALSLLGSVHSSDHRPYAELVALPVRDPLVDAAVRVRHMSASARGAELRRLHDIGYTISDLARALGCSVRTVHRWIAACDKGV